MSKLNCKQKRKKKQKLIDEYGSYCWWCGQYVTEELLTIEHLYPQSRGGSNSFENLRLSCFQCNNFRGNSLYHPSWKKVNIYT